MATSVVFPRVQFFANNGRPLIGGRIHTFAAGSSTRAPTYKDAAKAQPNTNPIILDGRGEAAIYLADGVEYKFVVEDSKGALIFTQEPVYGAVWPNAADWPSDATLSYQYMLDAKAAADSIGAIKFYDTYAQAIGDAANWPTEGLIEIARDETRDGARTRYRPNGATLDFVVNLDQVRLDLAAKSGASRVGYEGGNVGDALAGRAPIGFSGSTVDPKIGDGPLIARKWCTTEDLLIFVDPATGNDSGAGTQGQPLKTITAALQRVPQNIYHKVRIYLLDGDYGNEQIKLLNHFVTARGTAGLRIIGHCAGFDGEPHPIYTDDNPGAVKVGGFEHLFSGISGTEEMYVMGVTFTGCWVEFYDSCMWFHKCRFVNGMSQPGYSTRHPLGGHYCQANFTLCEFINVAMIGDFNGHTYLSFEQCTLNGLHMASDSRLPGRPFIAGNLTTIYIKDSPTLLAAGPGGKSISGSGGIITDFFYSPIGYANIRRASPARDEVLGVLSHDGSAKNSGRGAGIFLHGANESISPGSIDSEIGSNQFATWKVRHFSNSTLVNKELLSTNFYGELKALGGIVFGTLGRSASAFLQDGNACLYTNGNGDVFVLSKNGGVTKYVKILNYSTAQTL